MCKKPVKETIGSLIRKLEAAEVVLGPDAEIILGDHDGYQFSLDADNAFLDEGQKEVGKQYIEPSFIIIIDEEDPEFEVCDCCGQPWVSK